MTRAIICGVSVAVLLGSSTWAQTGDPYYSGTQNGTAPVGTGRPAAAAAPAVQFLNRRSFEMPVMLHDQEAREIRLYVSANGGRQWQLYNRYRPDAETLPFACRNDGEYWFSLYTVNQQNAVFPLPTTFEPMLKLRVDTQRPLLEAQAYPAEAGGLAVRWKATDPHLNPASFRVEYRPKMSEGRELPWRAAELPEPAGDLTETYEDSVTTWPETNARVLDVRISIADWAGNVVDSVQEVMLPLVTQTNPRPAVGSTLDGSRSAVAAAQEATREPSSIAWDSKASPEDPGRSATHSEDNRFHSASSSVPPTDVGGETNLRGGATPSSDRNWNSTAPQRQFEMTQDESAGRLPEATGGQPLLQGQPVSTRRASDSNDGGQRVARQPSPVVPSPADSDEAEELPPPLTGTRTESAAPPNYPRQAEPEPDPNHAISLLNNTPGIPTGEVARLTDETSFRLSYEVESAGPRGVAKVQLWLTEDAGQTWKMWGEDPDCQSPIAVQVPGEGVYGFRLVITARNGLAGETPQPGDLADMWVEVDQTAPTGELVSAPFGEDVSQGNLIIRWKAEDRNLGRRPITLHVSESATGPWDVLTAGLPNTGQYDWQIVPSLPKRVYLRLEVRDRAGNVHYDQLDRPVDLTALSPRGTLKGFEIN